MSSGERPLFFVASAISARTRSRLSAISVMRNCRAGAPPANAIISQTRGYSDSARKERSSSAEHPDMKSLSFIVAVILAVACSDLIAQNKIDLQPSDTIISILQKNIGQTVELRMKCGEKITG